MKLGFLRIFGWLQLVLGFASAVGCIVALFWLETSAGSVLSNTGIAVRELSGQIDQSRSIISDNQQVLDQVINAMEQSGKMTRAIKDAVTATDQKLPDLKNEIDNCLPGLNTAESWIRWFSDKMGTVGWPDGIKHWSVTPPSLEFTWSHPFSDKATEGNKVADVLKNAQPILQSSSELLPKIHELFQQINASCDQTSGFSEKIKALAKDIKSKQLGESLEHMGNISASLNDAAGSLDKTRDGLRLLIVVIVIGSLLLAFNGYGFTCMARQIEQLSERKV